MQGTSFKFCHKYRLNNDNILTFEQHVQKLTFNYFQLCFVDFPTNFCQYFLFQRV